MSHRAMDFRSRPCTGLFHGFVDVISIVLRLLMTSIATCQEISVPFLFVSGIRKPDHAKVARCGRHENRSEVVLANEERQAISMVDVRMRERDGFHGAQSDRENRALVSEFRPPALKESHVEQDCPSISSARYGTLR